MSKGSRSEVRGIQNVELRIPPFSHISCFARQGPWMLARFFNILLDYWSRCSPDKRYRWV